MFFFLTINQFLALNHFMCIPWIPKGLPCFMLFNIALLSWKRRNLPRFCVWKKQSKIPVSPLYCSFGCGVNLSYLKLKGVIFIRYLLARFQRSVSHWFRMALLALLLSFSWIHWLRREFIPESLENSWGSFTRVAFEK